MRNKKLSIKKRSGAFKNLGSSPSTFNHFMRRSLRRSVLNAPISHLAFPPSKQITVFENEAQAQLNAMSALTEKKLELKYTDEIARLRV